MTHCRTRDRGARADENGRICFNEILKHKNNRSINSPARALPPFGVAFERYMCNEDAAMFIQLHTVGDTFGIPRALSLQRKCPSSGRCFLWLWLCCYFTRKTFGLSLLLSPGIPALSTRRSPLKHSRSGSCYAVDTKPQRVE